MDPLKNLSFMVAAYCIAWVIFCGYLAWLAVRVRKLENQLEKRPEGLQAKE